MDTPEPPDRAADGSLTLHTTLLGDLVVPGGAARSVELEALSARAAVYATGPGQGLHHPGVLISQRPAEVEDLAVPGRPYPGPG